MSTDREDQSNSAYDRKNIKLLHVHLWTLCILLSDQLCLTTLFMNKIIQFALICERPLPFRCHQMISVFSCFSYHLSFVNDLKFWPTLHDIRVQTVGFRDRSLSPPPPSHASSEQHSQLLTPSPNANPQMQIPWCFNHRFLSPGVWQSPSRVTTRQKSYLASKCLFTSGDSAYTKHSICTCPFGIYWLSSVIRLSMEFVTSL